MKILGTEQHRSPIGNLHHASELSRLPRNVAQLEIGRCCYAVHDDPANRITAVGSVARRNWSVKEH